MGFTEVWMLLLGSFTSHSCRCLPQLFRPSPLRIPSLGPQGIITNMDHSLGPYCYHLTEWGPHSRFLEAQRYKEPSQTMQVRSGKMETRLGGWE